MAKNLNEDFFEEQTPSSLVKAKIVSEYFPKYCEIILRKPQHMIGYVDLFSGPGIYKDGKFSTPLLVATNCSRKTHLLEKVKLIFNDNYHCKALEENFKTQMANVTFKYKPVFRNCTVGEDENIDKFLQKKNLDDKGNNLMPSVLFIDPFGYKGVNTKVLASFLSNWGNEIFIFLNTKKINWATQIGKFDDLMRELFPTTIDKIREDRKYKLTVTDRLNLIIENLAEEYERVLNGSIFHTAFRFQEEDSETTSHFILHLTKSGRGFDLIKQIYDEFDNVGAILDSRGTYTFDAKKLDKNDNLLFDSDDMNIDILCSEILNKFKGRSISALQLFEEIQITNKYSRRKHTDALRKLVDEGKIISSYSDNIQHKVTVLLSNSCKLQIV